MKNKILKLVKSWEFVLLLILVLEFVIFGSMNNKFLQPVRIFSNITNYISICIISLFVTMVMITGGIDIQASSIVGLTSITIGVLWNDFGFNIWAAVGAAILLAALCMGVLVFTTSGFLSVALIVLVALLSALFGPLAGTLENEMVVVKDRATALSLNAIITDSLVILLDMGIGRAADASLPLALGLCGAGCLAALLLFGTAASSVTPVSFFLLISRSRRSVSPALTETV